MAPDHTDIARNLKIIEGLKVQLLAVVSQLFSDLYRGLGDSVLDALSALIIIVFSMANRLGFSIRQIDAAVEEILKERVVNHENSLRQVETELLEYWRRRPKASHKEIARE